MTLMMSTDNTEPRPEAVALLSVEEMYAADRAATQSGIAGATLMENAGAAVARVIAERWSVQPVTVLCGPGNNGGDGFVAARYLANRGWPVALALLGDQGALLGDAGHHAHLWNGEIVPLGSVSFGGTGLVIDALFGAGLSRPLDGVARKVVRTLAESGLPVVSVDMPSGIRGDDGTVLGEEAVKAELTVTFFRKKPGHLLYPGRFYCGETLVADIGIPAPVLDDIAPYCFENDPALWLQNYPRRRFDSHKYDFGHALVVGGGELTGAARLASRAALRVGAGLVSLACPPPVVPLYAQGFPSLMVRAAAGPGDLSALLRDRRRNAVLVGPGFGLTKDTREMVTMVLSTGRATVLDADALTAYEQDPDKLFASFKSPCVLTPHEGEFVRLFPEVEGNRLERCRAAAAIANAVVVLKGADTVIAAPNGRAAINGNAPPELATAGTGDVLAGLILGLLAQSMPTFEAACAAVWLQGAAAAEVGPGLIAEDIPENLPKVLKALIS